MEVEDAVSFIINPKEIRHLMISQPIVKGTTKPCLIIIQEECQSGSQRQRSQPKVADNPTPMPGLFLEKKIKGGENACKDKVIAGEHGG